MAMKAFLQSLPITEDDRLDEIIADGSNLTLDAKGGPLAGLPDACHHAPVQVGTCSGRRGLLSFTALIELCCINGNGKGIALTDGLAQADCGRTLPLTCMHEGLAYYRWLDEILAKRAH